VGDVMALVDWLRDDEVCEVTRFGGPPEFIRCGPTRAQKVEALIGVARQDFLRGDLTVDEFETMVAEILADAPRKPWKRA
jgi:hypothetical protein